MRRCFLLMFAACLSAAAARAQTNDHFYRGWRWQEDPGSPRAAGLAGAFIAIADDASAAALNPAGLMTRPRNEAMGSLLRRGSGTVGPGDSLATSTDVGMLGGSLAIGSRFAAGIHYGEPRVISLDMASYPLPDQRYDLGFLDASVQTLGAAAAFKVSSQLRIGAGVAQSRLKLRGVDSLYLRGGPELSHVRSHGTDSAVTAVAGVLYDPTQDLRIGLAVRQGASWEVGRTAFSPTSDTLIDPGSRYRMRAPDVYSAGAAYRLFERLRLSAQADLVRYSQIRDALDVRRSLRPQDYVLDDSLEGRVGLEYAWPLDRLTLQFRGGLWSQAPGSIRYVGANEIERATFLGSSRRILEAVGASVLFKTGLSVDGAAILGGDRTLVLAGARYRF